ncbi:conjugal transfer protein TrbL family protein [Hominenteromicrobium sp.]|uniref:conjugal transfer protein TrbL family protein n=1 Tax=Hominenteromicrobium sp. TaxID=3073581 RepID=UPI003AB6F812
MFASSSLEEVYHYVYYQLTSVALTMLDDVNGLSINFFSNEFIQAIVNFFTLFAWGLGLTGAAIAIMDFAVSYQTGGGGSFTGTGMNMLRLLVALLTFSSIPILLFQTSMDNLRHGAQRGRRINGRRNRQHNRFGQRRCAKYV